MDVDLFLEEQQTYDNAIRHIEEVRAGGSYDFERFVKITGEYGRLLKYLRKATKLSDKTATSFYRQNQDLADKINTDALTGIRNRRFLDGNLKSVINTLTRSNADLSVMMIDIDDFKNYNDYYGHTQGDVALKIVAQIISSAISRMDDFAARYGGEEFVVVLPNTDRGGAALLAEKILAEVSTCNIEHKKSPNEKMSVSIGVVTGTVEYPQCETQYIRRADDALYISKRTGKNKITYVNLKEETL